jgi:hypothetical protein
MLVYLARFQLDGERLVRRVADTRTRESHGLHGGELSPRYSTEVAADTGEQLVSARPATAWHGTRNTVPSRAATESSGFRTWLLAEGEASLAPRTQQMSLANPGTEVQAAEAVRVP